MNFNEKVGARQPQGPGGRKVKRVSDVNAVGPSVPTSQFIPTAFDTAPPVVQAAYGDLPAMNQGFNTNPQPQNYGFPQQQQQQQHINVPPNHFPTYANVVGPQPNNPSQPMPQAPNHIASGIQQQFTMLQQPIVQDMAMQYGQKLADQGKHLVESHFEKWVPVTRLKYYFAVDNKYVINKIRLLFFPFTHTDWSLKYDQENPVQPRYDINAPDLYIPTMAYITFVVLAGLMLGMQNSFSPEQLGIHASSALAYSIFELVIYSIILYVANIPTNFKTLDLVAFSGYKFVIIVACILVSIIFQSTGYYVALLYCSLSLGFFLLRTLKTKVLHDASQTSPNGINYDPYGAPQQTHQFDYTVGRKRKLYFLFFIVGCQAFFSFWMSKHLILNGTSNSPEVTP